MTFARSGQAARRAAESAALGTSSGAPQGGHFRDQPAHLVGSSSSELDAPFRIPSLDGVRAVAFTVVFVAHAGLDNWIPGGFGVTVFFFLSGYLITTLLRREFEDSGSIDLRAFYLRRAVRIIPPLYAALTIAVVLGIAGVTSGVVTLGAVVALLANVSNYYSIVVGDAELPPGTVPLWSIAVEEHFYLTYPLFFLGLMAVARSQRQRAVVIVAAALLILLWRVVLVSNGATAERTYEATDTRIDSLLWGCALALWFNPALDPVIQLRPKRELAVLAASLVVLLLTFVVRDEALRETVRYTIQGIALLPIFYLAIARADWPLFRWLDWRPVRYIGTVSYTMYLTHAIVLAVGTTHFEESDPIVRGVVAFGATFLVAHISYVLMERPLGVLRRRRLKARHQDSAKLAEAPV